VRGFWVDVRESCGYGTGRSSRSLMESEDMELEEGERLRERLARELLRRELFSFANE
jgi:hypothetical protein